MAQPHSLTMIFASQRSGSRLLCDDVASLGGMGHPREQFNKILPWQETLGPDDVFQAMADGHARGAPEVASVKMMVSQARPINRYLTGETAVPETQAMQNIIDWSKTRFERIMVLIIVRANPLDQAISRIVARKTKIYHSPEGDHTDTDLVELMHRADPDFRWKILRELCLIKSETDTLRSVAETNSDITLLVRYEDLAASVETYSSRLIDHAGSLGFSPQNAVATRRLSKVIDRSQVDAIKRDFAAFVRDQISELAPD